jgi:hypothetical protein
MKIKKNCKASTSDFWYDLTDGGYLKPDKICADKDDAQLVKDAIAIVKEFEESCKEQIEDFVQ